MSKPLKPTAPSISTTEMLTGRFADLLEGVAQ